jgi:hypothetical protein
MAKRDTTRQLDRKLQKVVDGIANPEARKARKTRKQRELSEREKRAAKKIASIVRRTTGR